MQQEISLEIIFRKRFRFNCHHYYYASTNTE